MSMEYDIQRMPEVDEGVTKSWSYKAVFLGNLAALIVVIIVTLAGIVAYVHWILGETAGIITAIGFILVAVMILILFLHDRSQERHVAHLMGTVQVALRHIGPAMRTDLEEQAKTHWGGVRQEQRYFTNSALLEKQTDERLRASQEKVGHQFSAPPEGWEDE